MVEHRRTTAEESPGRLGDEASRNLGDEVSRNLGAEYWSVDDCGWSSLCPGLPENLVDLLAPPILVGAVPTGHLVTTGRPGWSRPGDSRRPGGRHRRPVAGPS